MIDRLIGNPMPVPFPFVVKNASKMCSASSGGNPKPVSRIEIRS
jgi:hypothetical protein